MHRLLLKRIKFIAGNWSVFYIYKKTLESHYEQDNLLEVTEVSPEKYQLCFTVDGANVCRLAMLWGMEYKKRNFIKLLENEAKIISVETHEQYRGRGYAAKLLYACEEVATSKGISHLYARIWHSNKSSIKAFKKAGWVKHATKIELSIFGVIPVKFTINH